MANLAGRNNQKTLRHTQQAKEYNRKTDLAWFHRDVEQMS